MLAIILLAVAILLESAANFAPRAALFLRVAAMVCAAVVLVLVFLGPATVR